MARVTQKRGWGPQDWEDRELAQLPLTEKHARADHDLGHDHVKEWPEKDRDKNRAWVVQFCARCHSDPAKMHDFNPALPTDQLAKFKDSPHGHRLLDLHDDRAPSCVSCHSVHGIRPAKDPQSKVYAQRVPETCGACHANAETMAGMKRADGSPLPTTQRWAPFPTA